MNDWLKCDAVRVANGKLYLKNPTYTTYAGKPASKASVWDVLFGTRVIRHRLKPTRAKPAVAPRAAPRVKAKAKGPKASAFTRDMNDVVQALVGQGARKAEAKAAVSKVRGKGVTGFDQLFRGALKELT